jgi:DNA-binding transcriptional MerR regulator
VKEFDLTVERITDSMVFIMKTDLYDIKTICDETGVTARTVHFYIQQGLLPPAGSQGPGARYHEGHLARLKLIKLLQREHLPLSEIRRRIERLDDSKIEGLVREHYSRKEPSSSSAAEYIRSVLAGNRPLSSEDHSKSLSAQGNALFDVRESRQTANGISERSQWERILLAPDIELHIRRPLSRIQNRKVEAIIQYAREL